MHVHDRIMDVSKCQRSLVLIGTFFVTNKIKNVINVSKESFDTSGGHDCFTLHDTWEFLYPCHKNIFANIIIMVD